MPAYPRAAIVTTDQVGIYHCIARCVRRAFLCGLDAITGCDYEHRKAWIRDRLEQLAAIFAIEVCGYAVMSNHLHLILRTRPDLPQSWSDKELAVRWLALFPPRDPATGKPAEPAPCDILRIISDPARLAVIRERLASLSWFMRSLCEPIARRANGEDQCTGRFWEGRFKSQSLLDEAAVLACSVYVDLNPIRAGVAPTPEESEYTSAFDRIRSMPMVSAPTTDSRPMVSAPTIESRQTDPPEVPVLEPLTTEQPRADSWLCELTLVEGPGAAPQAGCKRTEPSFAEHGTEAMNSEQPGRPCRARRASDQGYLPITLDRYLELLDWTGRQVGGVSQGTIPAELAPILERLGINSDGWVETVRRFGRWFKTAAGRVGSLRELAARRDRAWLQGQGGAALAFR